MKGVFGIAFLAGVLGSIFCALVAALVMFTFGNNSRDPSLVQKGGKPISSS